MGPPGVFPWVFLVRTRIELGEGPRVIVFPKSAGAYRMLRIVVEGSPVVVYRVVLVYRSGDQDDLPVNWVFREGDWARVLRVRGAGRPIQQVIVYSRPLEGHEGERPVINVYGES